MAAAVPDAGAVRDAARQILSAPEFHRHETWWDRFQYALAHPWEYLFGAVDWVLSHLTSGGSSAAVAWAIVLGCAVAAGVLLARLAGSTARDHRVRVRPALPSTTLTAAELWAQATRFERDGRWRDAVRSAFAATVAELAERGLLRRRAGATTGEYHAQVRSSDPVSAPSFARAAATFDAVWYGNAPADATTVRQMRDLADALRARGAR